MTHYNLLRIFPIHKCNPCQKAVFADGCLGVPLRVGLSAASPRYAVGFPLQSLTWMKGLSLSYACTLAHGLFRPGVRFRPLRQPTLFKVIFYNIFYQQLFSLFP